MRPAFPPQTDCPPVMRLSQVAEHEDSTLPKLIWDDPMNVHQRVLTHLKDTYLRRASDSGRLPFL
ncbi:hypothetical protein PT974_05366 [Cladobotryum mycophilum]|uniref:Uncharacterized protein n=1 Tax=Cladobotryum mycophilum TaxID=491253 RepID=A0ABR0SJL7_9HYPO